MSESRRGAGGAAAGWPNVRAWYGERDW